MIDINCDLGEGEPFSRTRALMRRVSSANIACGGHAGSESSMAVCLRLCAAFGVNAGAHPGFEDREHFGRRPLPLSSRKLRFLLARQVDALLHLARLMEHPVVHVKLHGALYHVVESDASLARTYVHFIGENYPGMRIIALAGGRVVRVASRCDVPVWNEIFAERAYDAAGRLLPRTVPGAVISELAVIRRRALAFREYGAFPAEDGSLLSLPAQTICVHSDTPGAVRIAGSLAAVLRAG